MKINHEHKYFTFFRYYVNLNLSFLRIFKERESCSPRKREHPSLSFSLVLRSGGSSHINWISFTDKGLQRQRIRTLFQDTAKPCETGSPPGSDGLSESSGHHGNIPGGSDA